ncbi:MAG: hypothetical protein K0S21_2822 [Rhizobiaceae bacterium]|nr:hypothetical protein [Rhizobiaceae bacterium]
MSNDSNGASLVKDAITVLTIQRSNRANKLVRRLPDGTIEKEGGVESGVYRARQVPVPDVDALAAELARIGADPRLVLMPGLFVSAGTEPFSVWPRKWIARQILGIDPDTTPKKRLAELVHGWHEHQGQRVVARTRDNTEFSNWSYFDRDLLYHDGKLAMPQELADLVQDEWLMMIDLLWPTFEAAAKVIVPSTSGRILVDGKPWSTKPAFHCFFQVDDPDDLRNRVWAQMLVKAFTIREPINDVPLGFMRLKHSHKVPGLVTGRQPWSIWDPTTWWPERLVFDGAPVVEGTGLEVMPPAAPFVRPGGRACVAAFEDLPAAERKPAAAAGAHLTREHRARTGGVRVAVEFITTPILGLDHEFDTEIGPVTMQEFWIVGGDHLRCQAPFRNSTSWSAYLGRHGSGEPFCYDTGADTKFVLTAAARIGPSPEDVLAVLEIWLAANDDTIAGPLLAEGDRFIREAGAAAVRHERGEVEAEALIRQLAVRLAKPYGTTLKNIEAAIRRTFKSGRKQAREAAAAATVSAATASGAETVREAILGWYRDRYRPVVRRRNGMIYSEAEGWIGFAGIYPDEALRERMTNAADFPRDERGAPNASAAPRLYREWRQFAWGDLLAALSFEGADGAPRTEASEEFLLSIDRLLEAPVFLPPPDNTGMSRSLPLATWAWRYAQYRALAMKRPVWVQIEPYLLYARIKNERCWIGIKSGVAGQLLRPITSLAELSDTALTRRCVKEGIALPAQFGKNTNINMISCNGQMIRSTILRPSHVHRLGLFTDDPLTRAQQDNAQAAAKPGVSAVDPVVPFSRRKRKD